MLRWTQSQRELLAETVRDIANIAAGAMVFGRFLSGITFSAALATFGFAVWASLIVLALLLVEERAS